MRDDCSATKAYEAVQLEMAQYLSAPSTAIYQPWERVANRPVPSACIINVEGYLESQNGFGAMTKTAFRASVLKTKEGEYSARILGINGRLPGL